MNIKEIEEKREADYYDTMATMIENKNFESMLDDWYACFDYILSSFRAEYTGGIISDLFFNFSMCNWNALHIENTEYATLTQEELRTKFAYECSYMSDRTSYDRLFKAHWLFLNAYPTEMNEEKIKWDKLNLIKGN